GKSHLVGINNDITLRKEEDRYIERLFDGLDSALFLADEQGSLLYLNGFAQAVLGKDISEIKGNLFWELPQIRQYAAHIQPLFRLGATNRDVVEIEIEIEQEEQQRTFLLSVTSIEKANGVVNFIPYAVDITARKNAELQNELLVAELNHRSKNLFSVVNALISLSARHAHSVDDFASSTISRLSALHTAHDLGAADLRKRGASLFEIIEKTLAPWRTDPPKIFISGDNPSLDSGEATSWALIAHELMTNANKYGALGNGGDLHINMQADQDNWRLCWKESIPAANVQPSDKKGFGHTVIKRLSATYLDADVEFDFNQGGLHVTISSRQSIA
ncbi:MAG: HWE histidine kinase domain-containing protein, partial [Cyanobacteria bacterium J06553_1]